MQIKYDMLGNRLIISKCFFFNEFENKIAHEYIRHTQAWDKYAKDRRSQ